MNIFQMAVNWVKAHPLWALLFVAFLFTFDWLILNKKKLNVKWYAALILSALHVVIGVLLVKLFAFMEAGFDAEKAGNMSLFGAVFFLPVFYYLGALIFKRNRSNVFDVFAVAMVTTLMLARVNCLISGCCLGREIVEGGMRWPTREAELVFYVIFLIVQIPRVIKGKTHGRAYPEFMVAYGAFRAVVECFRVSAATDGILHISHIWAMISLILGILILLIMSGRLPVNRNKTKNRVGGK